MNNKIKYQALLGMAIVCLLAACEKEDAVVPNLKDTSFYFQPNDTCTDEESEIRREFFKTHGSYLLFNDTIQHYFVGIDINGDSAYFTEKLQISYSIGDVNTNNTSVTFNLLPNLERKKAAVQFLEERILYHFTSDLQPFSWLLVNQINYRYINEYTNPVATNGQRAIAVAFASLQRIRNEAQRKNYADQILSTLIVKIITDRPQLFTDFTDVSARLYSQQYEGYESASADECLKYLYGLGFLSRGKNTWNIVGNTYYPSQSSDLSIYGSLVAVNTWDQIVEKYGQYPMILQKARLMREALESIGYVFEKAEEED